MSRTTFCLSALVFVIVIVFVCIIVTAVQELLKKKDFVLVFVGSEICCFNKIINDTLYHSIINE